MWEILRDTFTWTFVVGLAEMLYGWTVDRDAEFEPAKWLLFLFGFSLLVAAIKVFTAD